MLEFDDGSSLSVRLDQGSGSWIIGEGNRPLRFDFDASPVHQVNALVALESEVSILNARHPSPLTLTWAAGRKDP